MGAHLAAQPPKAAPKRPAVYFHTPDPTSPSDGPQMRHRPVPPKWVGPAPCNQPHPPNLRPKYDAVLNSCARISFHSLTKNQKKKAMESLLYIFHYYGVKCLYFTAANRKNLVYRLNWNDAISRTNIDMRYLSVPCI